MSVVNSLGIGDSLNSTSPGIPGPPGRGISSMSQGTGETLIVTFTDGTTETFTVTNLAIDPTLSINLIGTNNSSKFSVADSTGKIVINVDTILDKVSLPQENVSSIVQTDGSKNLTTSNTLTNVTLNNPLLEGNIFPSNTTQDIGSSTNPFNSVFAADSINLYLSSTEYSGFQTQFSPILGAGLYFVSSSTNNSLAPAGDKSYALGTSSHRWGQLHTSNLADNGTTLTTPNNTLDDGSGNTVIKTGLKTTLNTLDDGAGNTVIKTGLKTTLNTLDDGSGNTVIKTGVRTTKNTLDDGSGNVTIAGSLKTTNNVLDDGHGNLNVQTVNTNHFYQVTNTTNPSSQPIILFNNSNNVAGVGALGIDSNPSKFAGLVVIPNYKGLSQITGDITYDIQGKTTTGTHYFTNNVEVANNLTVDNILTVDKELIVPSTSYVSLQGTSSIFLTNYTDVPGSGALSIANSAAPSALNNLNIIPGYRQSTQTNGFCTYDLSGTGTHYFWDNVEVANNLIVDGTTHTMNGALTISNGTSDGNWGTLNLTGQWSGRILNGITVTNTSTTAGSGSSIALVGTTSGPSTTTAYISTDGDCLYFQPGTSSASLDPSFDLTYSLGDPTHRLVSIWAQTTTISTSDGREKTKVKTSNLGLDFINKLRPVSYKWINRNYTVDSEGNLTPNQGVRTHHGFIAQEVENVLLKNKIDTKDFAGLIHDKASDRYGLRYEQFIAPLVKAIQELTAKVSDLEHEISLIKG